MYMTKQRLITKEGWVWLCWSFPHCSEISLFVASFLFQFMLISFWINLSEAKVASSVIFGLLSRGIRSCRLWISCAAFSLSHCRDWLRSLAKSFTRRKRFSFSFIHLNLFIYSKRIRPESIQNIKKWTFHQRKSSKRRLKTAIEGAQTHNCRSLFQQGTPCWSERLRRRSCHAWCLKSCYQWSFRWLFSSLFVDYLLHRFVHNLLDHSVDYFV